MVNDNIVPGPNFSFDREGIAAISRTLSGFIIQYKAGAVVKVEIEDPGERESQYYMAREIWRGTIDWKDLATPKTFDTPIEPLS